MGLKTWLLRRIGAGDVSVRRTCNQLYEKARRIRPDRDDRDCLRVVLMTKPPFDYQPRQTIEGFLDEAGDIEGLSDVVCRYGRERYMWKAREKMRTNSNVVSGREEFFSWFWHGE